MTMSMIQKMLLKYAYNDMRSHKEDCSFFDEEIKQFLMNSNDAIPKANITILCGLAVNVSPVPDAMFGNLKLYCFAMSIPILFDERG